MEKKDLATTILKLENSAHNTTQSAIKTKNIDNWYDRTYDARQKASYSEERAELDKEMNYSQDWRRYSDKYAIREGIDEARSGSRKRASLRRKYNDDNHAFHERSKSVISADSYCGAKHVDFTLQNNACNQEGIEWR